MAPTDAPAPPAVADAAYRFGEHVGRFAALTIRQLGEMAAAGAARAKAITAAPETTDSPAASAGSADAAPPTTATARAEELVTRAGGQFGAFAAVAGERLRKAAALAREEAEDVWAEAQERRRGSQRDATDAP